MDNTHATIENPNKYVRNLIDDDVDKRLARPVVWHLQDFCSNKGGRKKSVRLQKSSGKTNKSNH